MPLEHLKRNAEADPGMVPERLRMLAPYVDRAIVDAAVRRVVLKERFFKGAELVVNLERPAAKIALLIVKELNPHEDLQAEEEALLKGIDADTLRKRKSAPPSRSR